MRSQHAIDMFRIKENGGFSLNGVSRLELEWYKLGALHPDYVTRTDLYIKIDSKIAIGDEDFDLKVSRQQCVLIHLVLRFNM